MLNSITFQTEPQITSFLHIILAWKLLWLLSMFLIHVDRHFVYKNSSLLTTRSFKDHFLCKYFKCFHGCCGYSSSQLAFATSAGGTTILRLFLDIIDYRLQIASKTSFRKRMLFLVVFFGSGCESIKFQAVVQTNENINWNQKFAV